MSDLISRQALCEYALNQKDKSVTPNDIMRFPSARPERKPGKWEIYVISMLDGEGCRCSECGFEGAPYWDFCPGCGARMEDIDDKRKSD